MALCLTAVFAYSQVWTAQDSLHLKKLLESDQELHLNMEIGRASCRERV